MFSKACEYAIRAVIYIAGQTREQRRVNMKEISGAIDSPEAFTAKILQQLVKNNIVSSVAGVNGGFVLHNQTESIRLADVVNAIDGDHVFRGCGLGLKECSEQQPCPVHFEFKEIRDSLARMLEATSVADLAESMKDGQFCLKR